MVNQFRIRGRGRARGVFAGTNTGPSNSNTTFQKRPKEEEWDPEYTPKSKKYFLVGVENSILCMLLFFPSAFLCLVLRRLTATKVACMLREWLQLCNQENTRVLAVPSSASVISSLLQKDKRSWRWNSSLKLSYQWDRKEGILWQKKIWKAKAKRLVLCLHGFISVWHSSSVHLSRNPQK